MAQALTTTSRQQLTTARPEDKGLVEFTPFGAADKIKLSVSIIKNIVAVPTKSGATCTDRDAMRFMMLCQAQRLNPFAGDAFLVGYDGQNGPQFSLITAHQAFLKRAETCSDYEGMESGIIILADDENSLVEREGDFHLPNENVVGGWARVFRKGRKPTYRRLRMARFNKGFAEWKTDPAGMIVKCAESDALRSTFPSLLGGLYIQDEMSIDVIIPPVVRPLFDAPKALPKPAADQTTETSTQTDSPTPEVEAKPAAAPEATSPASGDGSKPTPNLLRGIKGLLKLGSHTEAALLAWLYNQNFIPDDTMDLATVAAEIPTALQYASDNWRTVDAALKAAKK